MQQPKPPNPVCTRFQLLPSRFSGVGIQDEWGKPAPFQDHATSLLHAAKKSLSLACTLLAALTPFTRPGFGRVGCPASRGSQIHRYFRCCCIFDCVLRLRWSREGSSKCDHLQHVVVHDVAEKADNCGIFYSIFDFGSKPPSSRTIRHEVVTGGCGRCSHSPFVVTETRGPFCAFAHRFSCGSLTRGPLR